MTKKYKSKKKSIRKVVKRSVKPRNQTIVNLGLGFPKKLMMTLKHSSSTTINSTLGSVGSTIFSCNGLWDPFLSGGGTQPMFFDEIMNLYAHYHVIGAKINIRLIPTISTIYPAVIGCYINDDATRTASTLNDCTEQSTAKYKYVNLNSTPQDLTFSLKWSSKKNFGAGTMANSYLRGDASSNPLEQNTFTIFGGCLGADTQQWYCEVHLEYIAIFNELRDIVGS